MIPSAHEYLALYDRGSGASFDGVPVTSNMMVLRTTWAGHANLDRAAEGGDLGILGGSWQDTGTDWSSGELNYDDTIDTADLSILAGSYGNYVPDQSTSGDAAALQSEVADLLAHQVSLLFTGDGNTGDPYPTGLTGWRVQRSADGGATWDYGITLPATDTSFTDTGEDSGDGTGLADLTTYQYRYRPVGPGVATACSKTVSATGPRPGCSLRRVRGTH